MTTQLLSIPPTVRNAKHKAFADFLLQGNSASEACRLAGYNAKNVGSLAAQIRKKPEVAEYLNWHNARETEKTTELRDQLLDEFSNIALSNIADYVRIDEDGEVQIDFSRATRAQLSAVKSVKTKKRSVYKDGEVIATEQETGFQLWDKIRAGELLGREHGLFKPTEQRVVVDVADRLLRARGHVMKTIEQQSGSGDGTE